MRLKWTNWREYQALTPNAFQQVDRRVATYILKCGFSWSPALSPDQPILLTPVQEDPNVEALGAMGLKVEEDKLDEPSFENGFDITGYLTSAWEALGIKRDYLYDKK